MMRRLAYILSIALLLCPLSAYCQSLPALAKANEISTGKLANGIDYYVVSNPHTKGFADFGLISTPRIEDNTARQALKSLPHFGSREPHLFFSDNGIAYSREGFISQKGNSSFYRFCDVPVYKQQICDSTIFALMDLASLSSKQKAVIISGDVDAAKIIERLKLLSMIAPKLEELSVDSSYKWTPREGSNSGITINQSRNIAAISVIFSGERLGAELMNTAQPLVSKTYTGILGQIICERADSAFKANNIPLAAASYSYFDSSLSSGDELFSLRAVCYQKDLKSANGILAQILGEIDRNGVNKAEFTKERLKFGEQLRRNSHILSNREYLDKCVAAFLYGSELASEQTKLDIVTRPLPIETELPIFNSFASALLDSNSNLTLRFDTPSLQVDTVALKHSFSDNWAKPSSNSSSEALMQNALSISAESARNAQLTALRTALVESKVKLSSESSEPLTGGKLWTFSNGIRVIFKPVAASGQFYYGLMLRGGLSSLSGIKAGEAAFASDMLGLSKIGGMPAGKFFDTLEQEGIFMQSQFTIQDFRITGHASKDKLPILLRSLTIIADDREVDDSQLSSFLTSQKASYDALALRPINPKPLIDSLLRPTYLYNEHRNPYNLTEVLSYKVDKYLSAAFSEFNSGIIVLMGDLDEDYLKKYLPRVLGNFKTQKASSHRAKVNCRYNTSSIRNTLHARSGMMEYREKGAYLGISAPIVYNIGNYYAFQVALDYLRAELASELSKKGAYYTLSGGVEAFPSERMNVYITCQPCFESGLPAGMRAAEPSDLARALRSTVAKLAEIEVSEERNGVYKKKLTGYLEQEQARTENVVEAAMTRYGSGKDVFSGGKDALGQVSVARVKEILTALSSALSVEYIIE